MRWKLLRRRLSIAAPRVIVRRHLPWPLRWAVLALVLGFSVAIAMWAYELGKELAGLDRAAKQELAQLRSEVQQLRAERDRAQSVANTADSLLQTERATQERLAQRLRQLEDETLQLKADLGFFERLLPAAGDGLAVRGVQVEPLAPGQLRYQLLVMQSGKTPPEFKGRVELLLGGVDDRGKPWQPAAALPGQALQFRQYARIEGVLSHPVDAMVKTVQVRVVDSVGVVRAAHMVKL
jgi:hypothetical protein